MYDATIAFENRTGELPQDLSDLDGEKFRSRRTGPHELALWQFEDNGVLMYSYFPKLLELRKKVPADEIPIAYANEPQPDGMHFALFADGYIEKQSIEDLNKRITELKKILENSEIIGSKKNSD